MPSQTIFAAPDKLLVKSREVPKASSVIYIKEDDPPPTQGVVISAGTNTDSAWEDKEVIFKKYSGQAVTWDGVDYVSIKPEDVIAIVKQN